LSHRNNYPTMPFTPFNTLYFAKLEKSYQAFKKRFLDGS